MEKKHTYIRELHSFFEGLAFIWIILCGLAFRFIGFFNAHVLQAKDHVDLHGVLLIIGLVVIYGLLAFFSKIRSFAVECAVAAWLFYIAALVEVGEALLGKQMEFFGSTGLVLSLGIIIATIFFALIGLLYLALRKSKIYDEQALMHTWYYKLYRFLRGASFVVALLSFIIYFSLKLYGFWNDSVISQSFKESMSKNLFTLTSAGAILMGLGYFTSVFGLGIELLIAGFILLFFVLGPTFIHIVGPDSLTGISWAVVILIIYAALISLFFLALRRYLKKHNH